MKRFFSKVTAAALSLAMCGMLSSALPVQTSASAASANWKFDFGNGGVENGYTGVTASTSYSAALGYGFSAGTDVADVAAAGSGALSDAVQFKNSTNTGSYTFCADVPNGLYQVSVWLGNTTRTSIAAEGMLQIINMTGNNAYDTFQIPVTDGQLNICACAGKEGYAFTMSALEITQISTSTETNPTIWICGDSTVCNYYPLDTSVQGGWGQMLPQYIDTAKWQVRNMAASGQYAAGFVSAGQFTAIETYGKAGDIYIISIGINDTNYSNAEEYYNVVTDMAKRAMAKGMRVILVKQQGRDADITRSSLLSGRWFGGTLDQIGSELGLEVVDLFNLWQDYRLSINDTNPSPLYMDGDDLHPNRQGAMVLAQLMAEAVDFDSAAGGTVSGDTFTDGQTVMLRNVNSGQYLSVADGAAANGSNVVQSSDGSVTAKNVWKLISAGDDGAYYLYSMLDGGSSYLLDVTNGAAENGTNIGIWENTKSDAQVYKLVKSGDYYHIRTAVTGYQSCIGVTGGSQEDGANVIEWESDGSTNQQWALQYTQFDAELPLLQGDLDGDGKITAKDLTLQRRAIVGTAASNAVRQAADVDGDLSLSADDAALLADYLTGKIRELPDAQYPAAEQSFSSGLRETVNSGFRYDDYLNLDNNNTSAMTFAVNVAQAGNYLCTFRIANGSANDRAMMISVSGQSDLWLQSFLTTGAWTTWEERALVLPLAAGVNYITLRSNTAEGGPNIDSLRLTFTDEPVAQPYDPSSEPQQPEVTDKPVVYVASDSTAQSYNASYAPQQGWGYYLSSYFTEDVTVSNHAIAGRSSKSFYDNGRLTTILDQIKAGDYLIVCFGINDGASSQPERYAPVCGDADNPAEGSFEYYMTFYIEGALEKGATPILMSPTLSIKNATQPFSAGYRNIDSACLSLAAKYNIPYFDLGAAMASQFNNTDYNTVYSYYMGSTTEGGTDFTHFTETGANVTAKIICDGIKGLNIGLSKYVS